MLNNDLKYLSIHLNKPNLSQMYQLVIYQFSNVYISYLFFLPFSNNLVFRIPIETNQSQSLDGPSYQLCIQGSCASSTGNMAAWLANKRAVNLLTSFKQCNKPFTLLLTRAMVRAQKFSKNSFSGSIEGLVKYLTRKFPQPRK